MHIRILPGRCVGAGQCVLAAPALFDQRDDDGTVLVLDETPAPDQYDAARTALSVCPSGTLRLDP